MATPLPEKSVFVAIGAWNPAIIQPVWLKQHFSYAVKNDPKIQISAGPGAVFSMILDLGEFLLDPNGGRLVFIPKTLDDATLSLIAKLSLDISKKLEHTPISAAGCNFWFRLDDGEDFALDEIRESGTSLTFYSGIGLKKSTERSIRQQFSLEDHNLNLTFVIKESERLVMFNYDYQSPLNAVVSASNALITNYHHSLDLCANLVRRTI